MTNALSQHVTLDRDSVDAVIADDGTYLPVSSLPKTYTYPDAQTTVTKVEYPIGSGTFYAYTLVTDATTGNLLSESQWVKQ